NVNYLRLSGRTIDSGYHVYYDNLVTSWQNTLGANWHYIGNQVLMPALVSYAGSVQCRFQDTSTTYQQFAYMDLLPGSTTSRWWIEMNVTWIRGRAYVGFWDGTNAASDRVHTFIIGNQGDTTQGELRYTTDGSTYYSLDTPTYLLTNVQYRITIVKISASPDRYDIYVDGVKKSSNDPGWATQDGAIQRISFGTATTYGSEDFYVDDIDCGWTQNWNTPSLSSPAVTPASGNLATLYNFTVTYTDIDNNPAQSITVTINGTTYNMAKANLADSNYVDGCVYSYTTYLAAGTYIYQFSCSDGSSGASTAPSVGPTVTPSNTNAPVLSNWGFNPRKGYASSTPFTFTVTYTDADNNAPVQVSVTLNSTTYSMVKQNVADNLYLDGCIYVVTTTLSIEGNYTITFNCTDGSFQTGIGPFPGPTAYGLLVSGGLLVFYPFDGNANDFSGNNNHGTPSGITYASGIMGSAAYFNGASYVQSPVYNSNSNYTLCALFNANVLLSNAYLDSPLIDSDYPSHYGKGIGATTTHVSTIYNNGWASCTFTFSTGTWYYLVVTFDHTHGLMTYYVNATRIGQITSSFTVESLFRQFFVGRDPSNSVYFTGNIDEMRIYNRVLSDAEVGLLMRPWNLQPPTLTINSVNPASGTTATQYTFRVTYTDPDNNAPASTNLMINGTIYALTKQTPADNTYTDGCVYQYITYLPAGTYSHYFTCSDGIYARSTASDATPTVSFVNINSPTLTLGSVSPSSGTTSTVFTYTITYTDADNNPPTYMNVTIDGVGYVMAKQTASDNVYVDGCIYTYSRTLATGTHVFFFSCNDGTFSQITNPYSGPAVNIGTVQNYIMTTGVTYNWQSTAGATALSLSDDGYSTQTLPFSFKFYDTNYTTIKVGANGYITFGTDNPTYTSGAIPMTGAGYRYIIAPFWDDLLTASAGGSGTVYVRSFGTYWVASWINVWYFSSGPVTGAFQVVFYMNGTIVFNYDYITSTTYGYVCGLNYGVSGSYYNVYTGLTTSTNDLSIRFTYPPTGNPTPPTLTLASVTPVSGNQQTTFNYTVVYTDVENNAPSFVRVNINGVFTDMTKVNVLDTIYSDGCLYQYITMLEPGTNSYWFITNDGLHYNQTRSYSGPTVAEVNSNAPTLSSQQATPLDGFAGGTSFTFSVLYTDADNNAPDSMTVTINGTAHAMTKQNPADRNYMDGCTYVFSTTLPAGTCVYYFNATDAPFNANLGPFTGPEAITSPYFDTMYAIYDFNIMSTPSTTTYVYSLISGCRYNVNILDTSWGSGTQTVDFTTRLLSGTTWFWGSGSHDLLWIYPWSSLGSTMAITVDGIGDHTFNVTSETILPHGTGFIYAWVLRDLSEPGTIAYYEKSTGMLLNGTFYYNSGANMYTIGLRSTNVTFYYAPMYLFAGEVDPSTGSTSISYNFTVQYFNRDNVAPINVTLVLDGVRYLMSQVNPSDTNYTDGVLYQGISSTLPAGTRSFSFITWSGGDLMRYPVDGSSIVGPVVLTYEFSRLFNGLVSPNISDENAMYRFSVMYQDTQNMSPQYMNFYLDGVQYAMTKDPIDSDYTNGVEYTYTNASMRIGTHSYYFQAANSTTTLRSPVAGSISGPKVVRRFYPSTYTIIAPSIDGFISSGEWDAARMYSGTMDLLVMPGFTTVVRTLTYTIFIFNDGTNLYIGILIAGETYNNFLPDVFSIVFDENRNGLLDTNENAWFIGTASGMPYYATHDYFYDGSAFTLDTSAGGTEDGASMFSHTNMVNGATGTYTFEMCIPIASLDPRDLQLARGDAVGFMIMYMDITDMAAGYIPWFSMAETSAYGVLMPIYPPLSTHPSDMLVVQNVTGSSITWRLQTVYTPGQYRVFRNGTVVQSWIAWPGNDTDIMFPVNTNIGLGIWNYTIQFNDNYATGAQDCVLVNVNDFPVVTGGVINNTWIARNATGYYVNWTIHDAWNGQGTYTVLLNGSTIATSSWVNNVDLLILVETNQGFGWFNYTLRCRDSFNFDGLESHVYVFIHDIPESNSPPDRAVIQNTAGVSIDWCLTDAFGPGQYHVLLNGAVLVGWTGWTNNTWINISVDTNVGLGVRNYTIQYNDSFGYAGIPDTVLIVINDVPVIFAAPTPLLVQQNATSVVLSWTIRDCLTNGWYSIYINGALYINNQAWINNTAIDVPVDTNRGTRVFNYSIVYRDADGTYGVPDWELVTIDDSPRILAQSSN
nr:LamG domain-containing protein [Candidatus Sigynarchaeota archaeon]